MLKDYIRKIRKAINENSQPVPTEVETFYSVLAVGCSQVPEIDITP